MSLSCGNWHHAVFNITVMQTIAWAWWTLLLRKFQNDNCRNWEENQISLLESTTPHLMTQQNFIVFETNSETFGNERQINQIQVGIILISFYRMNPVRLDVPILFFRKFVNATNKLIVLWWCYFFAWIHICLIIIIYVWPTTYSWRKNFLQI